jgi:hypothetical protein
MIAPKTKVKAKAKETKIDNDSEERKTITKIQSFCSQTYLIQST